MNDWYARRYGNLTEHLTHRHPSTEIQVGPLLLGNTQGEGGDGFYS